MQGRIISLAAVVVAMATVDDSRATSYPNRITCEGDSLSRAFNADDDCDDLLECIANFGDDLAHSYSCGTMANSLRTRLGATATVHRGKNGATWMSDSAAQTAEGLAAGGSQSADVTVAPAG